MSGAERRTLATSTPRSKEQRFDAIVVGAGPGGSAAACVLARGGARVALVDKADWPRDKACGDLVGPRGLTVLSELGVDVAASLPVGDMRVVSRRGSVRLRCRPGRTYPGHAIALPRRDLDARLRDAAVAAGAEPFVARASSPTEGVDGVDGVELSTGAVVRGDVVIGADGALSAVGGWAGLVDPSRVLWGFALRTYVRHPIALPEIWWWEPTPGRAYPGYGWAFPGPGGEANVGLGAGVLADRGAAVQVARAWPTFARDLVARGVLAEVPAGPTLGGWLKLGMVGTRPAARRVLLVGDAAGLVNPLQGEGISQALESGQAAALAVLADPATAAARYRTALLARFGPYQRAAAPLHAALLPRPRLVAALARLLTAAPVGRAVAGGWALYWNDLLEGAAPSRARLVAALAGRSLRATAAAGRMRRWFDTLADDAR